MEDLTLISCSYNTPEVTLTMLKSFFTLHDKTDVLLIDNSTNDDTKVMLIENKVPFISNPGGVHIKSVDILLDSISTKYALLVDTDIIFLKNHQHILDQFKNMGLTSMGDICGDRGGKKIHNRVHPWHCLINVEDIKKHGIHFFNEERHFKKDGKIYDVGCTFFADIREKGLRIGDAKLQGVYYKHYEGMSWRTNRYGKKDGDIDFDSSATHNNKALYDYGILIENSYRGEIEAYKNTKIKCN